MLVVVASGLLAGLVHVLSGPDHLAAVAPLAAGARGGWRTGVRWGAGHVAGVLLVGMLALALRGILPIDRVSGWSERMVGVVLIGIGAWGLVRALRRRVHVHTHRHDGHGHVHAHVHDAPEDGGARTHAHIHAAFAVGVIHGLAGSSHILGVLPALALPFAQGATYLVAFGVGTVAAMAGFSEVLGVMAGRAAARGTDWYRGLMVATSSAAILVGAYWLVS